MRSLLLTITPLITSLVISMPAIELRAPEVTSGGDKFNVLDWGPGKDVIREEINTARLDSLSNVAVARWFAPSCMGDYFPSLTSYCANVSRARARDCPVGLNVFRLLDPVTGEELSRRGQAMPRDCVARPGGPGVVTVEVVMREFQELPLAGSGITFAPTSGEPVINLPFIVQSSADPQLLNTTILGTRVLIEATPTRFAWDYGDGSQPFVTTDPNRRYPDHSYEHTYTKRGPVTVSLTTTWRGRFQVAGGAWQTIPGTVTTNETSDSITVIELLPVNIN